MDRKSEAEQPSQIFNFSGLVKLVRHVRFAPNSCQNVAVPRLSALCQKRSSHAPSEMKEAAN
jgi:hypothetical protein